MSQKDIVESYEKVFLSFQEPIQKTRASARERLVWFVGIAGYAILNSNVFWEALGNRKFTGMDIFWLSLPWALSALLSVITHFVIDEAGTRDDVVFTKKLAAIDLYKVDVEEGKANPSELIQILTDTHPEYLGAKRSADKWSSVARWLERMTFASLVGGFIWALIGPLLL